MSVSPAPTIKVARSLFSEAGRSAITASHFTGVAVPLADAIGAALRIASSRLLRTVQPTDGSADTL